MKMLHVVRLPSAQAKWWHEFCREMNLPTAILEIPFCDTRKQVTVRGTQADIVAAWELWHFEFKRICQL